MIGEQVSNCLQLAMLLEVSAYPKPGNIHRTADFKDTKYEHFLASTIAIGEQFRYASNIGVKISKKEIELENIGIGRAINNTVSDMLSWQSGGNTSLGVIILLMPIAISAGMVFGQGDFSRTKLRNALRDLIKSTTYEDALETIKAIRKAKPGGLGRVESFDITDNNIEKRILKEKPTLLDLFKISSEYDSIANEWADNYPISFDIGYPYFIDCINNNLDTNSAIVQTFMHILSEFPDSLVIRKHGIEKARKVSVNAKEILNLGGITSIEGRERLNQLDKEFRSEKRKINPGTTADLTASTLSIAILDGFRP
ncbi:MAG: triphosphoribosyl-dephospho-CoA synthase [Candidatus Bathyarchaeota archaeon]|nr:triphosphoribosyl-dephospho-CoA synthase [Candidatus Bathyarchaeota archaeon]